jgi:hypothetical protein
MSTLDENEAAVRNAITRLRALGRDDLADAAIADAETHASYADIGEDSTRSAEGKLQGYAGRYANVMSSLAKQLTAATDAANRAHKAETATLFGTAGLSGDQKTFLQRDADERAARAQSPAELQHLLATAIARNDHALSRAVAQAAVTRGDADTANAFQQHYPEHADTYEKVWNVEQAGAKQIHPWQDTLTLRVGSLKPDSLKHRMNQEIDGIAATTQDA